jgi:hypothetical protein
VLGVVVAWQNQDESCQEFRSSLFAGYAEFAGYVKVSDVQVAM